MRVKTQLRQIKTILDEIEAKHDHVRQLEEMASRITAQYGKERVQSSNGTTMADAVAKMADLKSEIAHEIQALCEAKMRAMAMIAMVDNGRLRSLLTKRYLTCMTWEQIAVDFDITYQWVHVLHSRALAEIEKKLTAVDSN